jgi:squalene synthase HpnC
MNQISDFSSGKGHTDENFPVASVLISPRHRAPILAFYNFVRAADDVADNATAAPEAKLAALEELRAGLTGEREGPPVATILRGSLKERGLTDQHALDLLEAFRRDVTKLRYESWFDLIDYCRWSAMPVGRFVLDVHGEDRALWEANDALCAALQVINHVQDCAKDYRELDRVYLPQDIMASHGATVEMLAEPKSPRPLRRSIRHTTALARELLEVSKPFASQIRDTRLALEVEVIQRLAEDLVRKLLRNDPLCEPVHHSKPEALVRAAAAVGGFAVLRPFSKKARAAKPAAEE